MALRRISRLLPRTHQYAFTTQVRAQPIASAVCPDDIAQFDHLSANVLPKIRQFIMENSDEDVPICNVKSFDEIQKESFANLPDEPISSEQFLNEIDLLLKYSPRSGKARFVDKLYSGSDAVSQFASYLLSVINNNCHTYNSSQVLTVIEETSIRNLCKVFFKQDASPFGGVFLPGGAYSNCIAFRLARDKYFPQIASDGAAQLPVKPTVLTSDQSHYSVMTACSQIGIGSNNVIKLETHTNGTINIAKCEQVIEKLRTDGERQPFILSCNAGTTVYGAFDNFVEIRRICDQYDMWMHIDGCWGGAAVFGREQNQQLQALTNGIELADSIAFDAHKLLSTGLLCGCLLVKDEAYLYTSCEPPNAKYLFHGAEGEPNHDIGAKTLQCGRQCDALKLYLSWLYYGKDGLSQRVLNGLQNAAYLCEQIRQSDDFLLVQDPMFSNVCFWYIGNIKDESERNRIKKWKESAYSSDEYDEHSATLLETTTKEVYFKLQVNSNSMVDYSPCKGLPSFFRMITSNYRLTDQGIDGILNDIRTAATTR